MPKCINGAIISTTLSNTTSVTEMASLASNDARYASKGPIALIIAISSPHGQSGFLGFGDRFGLGGEKEPLPGEGVGIGDPGFGGDK